MNMIKSLLFFICCFLFSSCNKKDDTTGEELTVGMSVDYAPYEFYQNNEIVGCDVDIIKEIAKRLGKKIKISDINFDAIVAALQTKKINLAISCISKTKEKEKNVDFSTPYHNFINALIFAAKKNIQGFEEINLVGVQSGSTYESDMIEKQKIYTNLKTKSITRLPDLIQELKVGRIDAILCGEVESKKILEQNPNFKSIIIAESSDETVCIAFPKNSKLKVEINKVINEMKTDGTLEKIKQKWLA